MGKAHIVVDQILFDAAKKQLEICRAFADQGEDPAERHQYWEAAFSGAAIAMVCAGMEAHANYLYHRAVDGELPLKKPLPEGGFQDGRWAKLAEKWLILSERLAGKKVLAKGRPPFQGFCAAVRLRNDSIMHPKMHRYELPDRPGAGAANLLEAKKFTLANAEAAVEAAAKTVLLVYGHMDRLPPRWASHKPYTRITGVDVVNAVGRGEPPEPEDWLEPDP